MHRSVVRRIDRGCMMPYEIRREGSQYCVYNKDTGKKVPGCSDSQEMAVKHMRALYAVEGGATLRKDLIAASADSPIEVCACDACIVQDIGDLLDLSLIHISE